MTELTARRAGWGVGAVAALVLAMGGGVALPASAVEIPVTNAAELAAAIDEANTTPGEHTILLSGASADYVLTAPLPAISAAVTLSGPGSGALTLDLAGQPGLRFDSAPGAVLGLTIAGSGTIGIDARYGLALNDVAVTGAQQEGVVAVGGAVSVFSSSFVGNGAEGLLAIPATDETLMIADVTASGNGGNGVLAEVDTAEAIIAGLVADGNGWNGLTVDAWDATVDVSAVSLTENALDGLYLIGSGASQVVLSDASAEANVDDGMDLQLWDDSTLVGVDLTVSSNLDYGIDLDSDDASTVDLNGMLAEDNARDNVKVNADNASSITLSGVQALSSRSDAGFDIGVSETASLTLIDSVAIGNDRNGVEFGVDDDAVGVISRVVASGNADSGFDLSTWSIGGSGVLLLSDSTAQGNGEHGVEADAEATSILIERTTIIDNIEQGLDSVVYDTGVIEVVNSTIVGNGVDGGLPGVQVAGALWAGDEAGRFDLALSTITGNGAGVAGGESAALSLRSSIVADNAGEDLLLADGAAMTVDHSLIRVPSGAVAEAAVAAGTGNLVGVDPHLGPLADNGGITLTRLPAEGSPVVDAGDPAFVPMPETDQRGEARVVGGVVDMGAVELQPADAPAPVLPPTGSTPGWALGLAVLLLGLGLTAAVVVSGRRRA